VVGPWGPSGGGHGIIGASGLWANRYLESSKGELREAKVLVARWRKLYGQV